MSWPYCSHDGLLWQAGDPSSNGFVLWRWQGLADHASAAARRASTRPRWRNAGLAMPATMPLRGNGGLETGRAARLPYVDLPCSDLPCSDAAGLR